MAKSGIQHADVGDELSKTEWLSEESHQLVHGSSFPASPVERQLFYRDDEHKWYVYNGTSWMDLTSAGGGGVTDHGALTGLGDDDHTQYLNVARHDLTARHPLSVLDSTVCSETEADGKITTHKGDASAHHTKTTAASEITSGRFGMPRMPDGTDNYVLTAKGAGVDPVYAAAAGGGFASKARAYRSTNQSIPNNSWTLVDFDAESFDVLGEFDPATDRFTAQAAGYYLIIGAIKSAVTPAGDHTWGVGIYKNGANLVDSAAIQSAAGQQLRVMILDIGYLAANDYLQMKAYQDTGAAADIYGGEAQIFMTVHRIS